MTLQELKDKYAGIVHRQSALELKGNPVFMKHCRENEDFKQWVLDRKPTMGTVRLPVTKFEKLKPVTDPEPAKHAHGNPVASEDKASVELVNQFKRDYDLI